MASISIKPEREYLREIAAKIKNGRYAIPVFQRDFVWKKEQVLDLFDSISKGYPIGSIILWKPEENHDSRAKDIISDKIINVSSPEFYVLDGRQRLTTFYGCVTKLEAKEDVLKIVYNLDKDCFEYARGRSKDYIMELPDVYDTLSLLTCLQKLMSSISDKEKLATYVDRAKAMNARLQSYEIGEVQIENCSLDEAGTVFSRINSKGTDISKVSMLQAIYYKDERTPLLSDEINDLISSLAAYGFEDLRQDDILNCCCRYIGKNFYDSNIMEDLVKNDLTQHLDSIKSDVTKAVSFLHDECGVLSYKMLPYAKQLVGITNFFKEIKEPSESQIKELKKWFFYTTVCQSFQNSSLTAVRPIFRDLDKFIKGESQDAVEKYGNIQIPYLDFRFSTQSALSNLLMITLANIYVKRSAASDLAYIGQGKLLQDSPVGIFLFLNSQDKQIFSHIINGGDLDFIDFEKYALTQDMLKLLKEGNFNDFKRQRDLLLVNAEKELLQQVGLLVE
ncbi:DUF262 domain-containing protein [Segatella hominis]|uniref:DUF262 domain-containing protein n=1 Tax=Segatella hominis TaxID=2518605 RepID=A0A4Y8VL81_9BACT|nr:DUF262 domain-containing protein [Segatella hominis]TFH81217.1 DUF262 domain-containing protein [Segatella hominis]